MLQNSHIYAVITKVIQWIQPPSHLNERTAASEDPVRINQYMHTAKGR